MVPSGLDRATVPWVASATKNVPAGSVARGKGGGGRGGVGYWGCWGRGEWGGAGVARDAEVGPGSGGEIDVLIDDEGEWHRSALAADRSGGEDNIAVEFARDAVAGVGEREVAEAIDGEAAGGVER